MSTKQIEDYESPYNIVFGDDGQDAQVIAGPGGKDFPIWRARHFVMAILKTQAAKSDDTAEKIEFENLRQAFQFAETGEMVFGYVRRFINKKGRKRFIGITPKGTDYRDAGKVPDSGEPKRTLPPLPPPGRGRSTARATTAPRAPKPPKVKPPTEAERIADKMAKAARKAVEG